MNKEKLDIVFRLGILAAVSLIAISIAYYLFFYLPRRDNKTDTQQRVEKTLRNLNYASCLNKANKNYNVNWAGACKIQKQSSPNCILKWGEGDKIDKSLEDDKNRCLKEALSGLD